MSDNTTAPSSKSAAAIVGLVLGIVALLTSFMPFINNFSFILAALGLVFAVVGLAGVLRGKKVGKGMAIASVVVNVLAIAIVLGTQSMYSAAIDEATKGTISTADGSAASAVTSAATSADASADAQAEPADKYSIEGEELEGDEYSSKVVGTFTNNSGAEIGYVQVSYNLYDSDGNQIGTALANTSNLADGGTWKFEAYGTQGLDKVASFKLGEVTGF